MNSVIDGIDAQEDLIRWKAQPCSNLLGTVGKGYWRGYMKRHGHKIVSKRGVEYALNRSECSTYHNFDDMYTYIYNSMELSGATKRRDESVWMDHSDNVVEEVDAFGYQIIHDFVQLDMCLVGDEVVGDIHMTANSHQGVQFLLCKKGIIP